MGIERVRLAFVRRRQEGGAALVAFTTGGYEDQAFTAPALLALERGGADILEIGIPYSDPVADGPTIQQSSLIALDNGTTLQTCLTAVKEARESGLKTAVLLMGYWNVFLQFGQRRLVELASTHGVDGFIIVDVPPEELKFQPVVSEGTQNPDGTTFCDLCTKVYRRTSRTQNTRHMFRRQRIF
eukprot:GHVT01005788.1.p1 GENE.GHVT01005788.1~~GHVT01005788.1.p1  ORF type:complete len:208 (-),score=26.57 GHVT01005788.1:965-1516(-)